MWYTGGWTMVLVFGVCFFWRRALCGCRSWEGHSGWVAAGSRMDMWVPAGEWLGGKMLHHCGWLWGWALIYAFGVDAALFSISFFFCANVDSSISSVTIHRRESNCSHELLSILLSILFCLSLNVSQTELLTQKSAHTFKSVFSRGTSLQKISYKSMMGIRHLHSTSQHLPSKRLQ